MNRKYFLRVFGSSLFIQVPRCVYNYASDKFDWTGIVELSK